MRRASLVPLLLAAGCELIPPPTEVTVEPRTEVHSLLRAGSDTVAVLIEQTGTEGGFLRTSPVFGARVRIAGAGREVTLEEAPPGFPPCVWRTDLSGGGGGGPQPIGRGCYAAVLPGGVRVGEEYSLAVELPDGGTVSGRTLVPLPPQEVQPAENVRVPMHRSPEFPAEVRVFDSAPVTLRWRLSTPGSRVAAVVVPGDVYEGGRALQDPSCALQLTRADGAGVDDRTLVHPDSLRVRGRITACGEVVGGDWREVRPDSVATVLRFTAMDSLYSAYLERSSDGALREGSASAGLSGAFGVFGSSASIRRRIVWVLPGS